MDDDNGFVPVLDIEDIPVDDDSQVLPEAKLLTVTNELFELYPAVYGKKAESCCFLHLYLIHRFRKHRLSGEKETLLITIEDIRSFTRWSREKVGLVLSILREKGFIRDKRTSTGFMMSENPTSQKNVSKIKDLSMMSENQVSLSLYRYNKKEVKEKKRKVMSEKPVTQKTDIINHNGWHKEAFTFFCEKAKSYNGLKPITGPADHGRLKWALDEFRDLAIVKRIIEFYFESDKVEEHGAKLRVALSYDTVTKWQENDLGVSELFEARDQREALEKAV